MKVFFSMLFLSVINHSFAQKDYFLLTGTYTSTGSEGIYVHHFNTKNADSYPVDSVKVSNPSFLAVSSNQQTIYAVNENANDAGTGGGVTSLSFNNKTGSISVVDSQSSRGNHPCYISVDKTGKWVAVGNYGTGNFTVLPVAADQFLDFTAIIQGSGNRADKVPDKRQAGPHVHSTVFSADNRFLVATDLGNDQVFIYRFNSETGNVYPASQAFVQTTAGSGPRHFVFHPNNKFAYLIQELSGTIDAYQYNATTGSLTIVQTISSVAPGFKGFPGSADIHLSADGKFLYATNRGDANDIAIYKVNKKDGKLSLTGHQPVLGKAPRNFSIDPSGKFLLVANQDSDEIVIFLRNKRTGLLTDSRKRIKIPKPVCLKWVPVKK